MAGSDLSVASIIPLIKTLIYCVRKHVRRSLARDLQLT